MVELNFDDGCEVYSSEYDDIYFNPKNSREECEHVFFMPNKIRERLESHINNAKDNFVITELGFGTGLNFFHLLDVINSCSVKNKSGISTRVLYRSVEKVLLRERQIISVLEVLNLAAVFHKVKSITNFVEYWQGLSLGWNQWECEVSGVVVRLELYFGDVSDFMTDVVGDRKLSDVWFLDGFAPSKNDEMWMPAIFKKMSKASNLRASYSTFTVAGKVRRGLLAAGFTTVKISGYGKKREMLSGELAKK